MTHAASSPLNTEEILLWEQWRSTGNLAIRDKLVAYYRHWLKEIAQDMFKALAPEGLSFADIMHYGTLGLLESIDRFDLSKGSSFTHFARLRIRGAISSHVAKPSERDIASDLAMQEQQQKQLDDPLLALVDFVNELVVEELLLDSADNHHPEEAMLDAYASTEMHQVYQSLEGAIDQLSTQESTVIRYHYFHHLSLQDIADIMQLSKGRASQIHSSALAKIRTKLGMSFSQQDIF